MIRRLIAASIVLASPLALSAQTVLRGTLLEQTSGRPMYCWGVRLLDSAGVARDSAVSDRRGAFAFANLGAGLFQVQLQSPYFADVVTEPERFTADTSVTREYHIELVADEEIVWQDPAASPPSPIRATANSPGPQYPRAMRAGGIEGWVHYAYAVDTLGRLDTASAFLVRASNLFFARSVEAALPSFRFEPWRPTRNESCARTVAPFIFRLQR